MNECMCVNKYTSHILSHGITRRRALNSCVMVAQRRVIYLVAWQGLKLHKHGINMVTPLSHHRQEYIIQIEVRARTQRLALNNSQ